MFSYMLCFPCFLRLINKLQPGSVKKINLSQLNWHKVRLNWKGFHCLLITKSNLKQAIEVLLGSLFQSPSLLFFSLFLLLSAAGKPWEFHQSYPGLWPKAQWHLWGQWPVWKWEHDSSPDHTACTGQHGEWTHSTKGYSLLRKTFCIVKGNKCNVTSILWPACPLC